MVTSSCDPSRAVTSLTTRYGSGVVAVSYESGFHYKVTKLNVQTRLHKGGRS